MTAANRGRLSASPFHTRGLHDSAHPRPLRRNPDLGADGPCRRIDLRCGRSSLFAGHRRRPGRLGPCPRYARAAGYGPVDLQMDQLAQADLGARDLHLPVRVDGEVRRGLWGAHRHPCRRRSSGAKPDGNRAEGHDRRRDVGRDHLYRDHRLDRDGFRLSHLEGRPDLAGSRDQDVDRLSGRSGRFGADVLSLRSGAVAVSDHRPCRPSRYGSVEGVQEEADDIAKGGHG